MPSEPPRLDLYVVARLLETLARKGNRSKKTPLQIASGVNYAIFTRYLEVLLQRRLVEVEPDHDGADWVVLTAKGAEALRFLTNGIQSLLPSSGGGSPGSPAVGKAPPPDSVDRRESSRGGFAGATGVSFL